MTPHTTHTTGIALPQATANCGPWHAACITPSPMPANGIQGWNDEHNPRRPLTSCILMRSSKALSSYCSNRTALRLRGWSVPPPSDSPPASPVRPLAPGPASSSSSSAAGHIQHTRRPGCIWVGLESVGNQVSVSCCGLDRAFVSLPALPKSAACLKRPDQANHSSLCSRTELACMTRVRSHHTSPNPGPINCTLPHIAPQPCSPAHMHRHPTAAAPPHRPCQHQQLGHPLHESPAGQTAAADTVKDKTCFVPPLLVGLLSHKSLNLQPGFP